MSRKDSLFMNVAKMPPKSELSQLMKKTMEKQKEKIVEDKEFSVENQQEAKQQTEKNLKEQRKISVTVKSMVTHKIEKDVKKEGAGATAVPLNEHKVLNYMVEDPYFDGYEEDWDW